MTKTIDAAGAVKLLSDAVTEKGFTHIDPNSAEGGTCRNVVRDQNGALCPSCIAGTALARAGIPLDFLHSYNGSATYTMNSWNERKGDDDLTFTPGAMIIFRAAQMIQDKGETWGAALEHAQSLSWALDSVGVN